MPWDDRLRSRLKLRDLDVLLAVIETGGIGKAARRLNISQPAASKAIADLERMVGVRLLDRSRQGIAPTPQGLALGRRGTAVFDELRQGVKDMDFLSDPNVGEIRIGSTEPLAAGPIAATIDRLVRRHPGFTFHAIQGDTATLMRRLEERDIELAVARVYAPDVVAHMNVEVLYHDLLVVAAGARNPWTRRRNIDLADLMDEPWALPPSDTLFVASLTQAFHARGLALPRTVVATQSLSLRNSLLATGHFLTVDGATPLRFTARQLGLKALPIELPTTRRPVAVISLKNRTPSPLARLFVDQLRALTGAPIKSR
jgi:DNA-binding transcriptional LysR family regulator